MDLVFLIAITAFIVYKLFQSLGREDKDLKQFKHIEPVLDSLKIHVNHVKNVEFEIISIKDANLTPEVKKVFEKLLIEEKSFSINHFIDGAKKAFKMILIAFNSSEIQTLKELLAPDVYEKFITEVNDRISQKIRYNVTLVGIKEANIIDANIINDTVSVKLEIISEQIITVRDKDENIIFGNASKILPMRDIWTYSKKIKSGNLWRITQTESKWIA